MGTVQGIKNTAILPHPETGGGEGGGGELDGSAAIVFRTDSFIIMHNLVYSCIIYQAYLLLWQSWWCFIRKS